MNKIYRYICDSNHFHSLAKDRRLGFDWVNKFDGRIFGESWRPIQVHWDYADNGGEQGDFSQFAGHIPALNEIAWRCLNALIAEHVEQLPLRLLPPHSDTYHLLNVVTVIDALDHEHSDIKYFEGGRIMHVLKHVFHSELVADTPIFRIRGYEFSAVYVNEEFRCRVEAGNLTGLLWEELV